MRFSLGTTLNLSKLLSILLFFYLFNSVLMVPDELFTRKSLSRLSFKSKLRSLIVNGVPSVDRAFYVQIFAINLSEYIYDSQCGGFVHESGMWVITAAHCVYGLGPEEILVQYRDYTQAISQIQHRDLFSVQRRIIAPRYDDDIRYNNIALLKLYVTIILRPFGRLPLCSTEAVLASKMSTCGMGSIAAYDLDQKADVLMEATFQEFQMSISNPFNVDMCREDNVCAMPVTQWGGGNFKATFTC
ncbi:tryptase-like [Convolutriloba macropyga]|uniref:tryptase-like n=1 Tax=Convolutriloba macropyga TaxID=536237 RepID=UPI003F525FFA